MFKFIKRCFTNIKWRSSGIEATMLQMESDRREEEEPGWDRDEQVACCASGLYLGMRMSTARRIYDEDVIADAIKWNKEHKNV